MNFIRKHTQKEEDYAVFYETELFFAKQLLKKHHIPSQVVSLSKATLCDTDHIGISRFLGDEVAEKPLLSLLPDIKDSTVYKIRNLGFLNYIYFLLPDSENKLFIIGPYSLVDITPEKVLELGEKMSLQPQAIKQLEFCLSQVTSLASDGPLTTITDTLSEFMWGEGNYRVENTATAEPERLFGFKGDNNPDDTALKMKLMEQRYFYENELMDAVTHGKTHKAEMLLSNFSQITFDRRLTDQLRNTKNYAIIMNTLLRKAAQNGGVHPIYIDALSTEYAKKIEMMPSVTATMGFMREMFLGYCTLVRRKAMGHYSPLVQKAIACIDGDLTADLSLKRLADMNKVSESYFSTLFKKETGKTLTVYVTDKRMEKAKTLLRTTNLQVQTVAQHCGIFDVHYFSKMFKAKTGQSPKEYRQNAI